MAFRGESEPNVPVPQASGSRTGDANNRQTGARSAVEALLARGLSLPHCGLPDCECYENADGTSGFWIARPRYTPEASTSAAAPRMVANKIFWRLLQHKMMASRLGSNTEGSDGRSSGSRRCWRRLVAASGLEGMLVHDLRRTAARDFRRAGVSGGRSWSSAAGGRARCSIATTSSTSKTSRPRSRNVSAERDKYGTSRRVPRPPPRG